MKKDKKILLLVDCQYDFINGNLAVNGAEEAMDKLAEYIHTNANEYETVVLTVDWHPQTHCSFKKNGGTWPTHCVQHTYGASMYLPLFNALTDTKIPYIVLTKGLDEDHEEYSIFKNEESSKKIVELCKNLDINKIDVGGIAFDYCVGQSVKDGLKALPNVEFNIFKEYSPSIARESEDEFIKFIENSERVWLV